MLSNMESENNVNRVSLRFFFILLDTVNFNQYLKYKKNAISPPKPWSRSRKTAQVPENKLGSVGWGFATPISWGHCLIQVKKLLF